MPLPYFPMYPKDFFADDRIAELDTTQQGLFVLLLMRMWMAGNELADNDSRICRVLRVESEVWLQLKAAATENGLLRVDNGFLRSGRLTAEFTIAEQKCEKKRGAANTRWAKEKDTTRSGTPDDDPFH
jgi:uncharacterized protein YdaU (DUF1376 family)